MITIQRSSLKNIPARAIDFGKNEGGLDSLERYFFDSGVTDRLGNDKNTIIVGRKGTGKTAIASHLLGRSRANYNEFVNILSFRHIPVSLLESFEETDHVSSGRYTSVWRLIILIELSKLVVKNETLDPDKEARLRSIIECVAPNLETSPLNYLKKTKQNSFRVNLKVVEAEQSESNNGESIGLIDYVDSLQSVLIESVKIGDKYCVILDELDDSYADSNQYYDLMIALFKATMDMNRDFFHARIQLNAMIALREDIYDSIEYSDKNKWDDSAIRIEWIPKPGVKAYDTDLFKMINLRIGASYLNSPNINHNYWEHAYAGGFVTARLSAFKYILSRTMYRPRDVIQFCKCIKEAARGGTTEKFTKEDVLGGEMDYSNWLINELVDELHVKLPEIRQIFEALKRLKEASFRTDDINGQLAKIKFSGLRSVKDVLSILFDFCIIGFFEDNQSAPIFRYRNPHRKFEVGKKYSVHYGLRAALRLNEKDIKYYRSKKKTPNVNRSNKSRSRRPRRK